MPAVARIYPVSGLRQLTAARADKDILGVPSVRGKQIAGKQIDILPTVAAGNHFDPQKILNRGVLFRKEHIPCGTDVRFLFPAFGSGIRRLVIGLQIQMLDFLFDDPIRHGVDIEADHVATQAVRFQKRRSAPHERIGDPEVLQVVRSVKGLAKRKAREFGKQQSPEQGPRPPGEPLMHRDDRPVVLLDLFLPQRQIGNERYVEVFFNHHWTTLGFGLNSRSFFNHLAFTNDFRGAVLFMFHQCPLITLSIWIVHG